MESDEVTMLPLISALLALLVLVLTIVLFVKALHLETSQDLDDELQGVRGSLTSTAKAFDHLKPPPDAPKPSRPLREAAVRIGRFKESFEAWYNKPGLQYIATITDLIRELNGEYDQAENPNQSFGNAEEQAFDSTTEAIVRFVLRTTDMNIDSRAEDRNLQQLVKNLVAQAGMEIIDPRPGDPFDRFQHDEQDIGHKSHAGITTIKEVIIRGLARNNTVLMRAVVRT
jgi:hypothetical protein